MRIRKFVTGLALSLIVCSYCNRLPAQTPTPSPTPENFVCLFAPEYSTYLGGSNAEMGYDIAVDSTGCAYLTGITYANDFPTFNPFDGDCNYCDAFITKLSSSGSSLVYSTYLGGSNGEVGYAISVGEEKCAYVSGHTSSRDFPTQNPYQPSLNGRKDAFVTKLSSSGSWLTYSTYLGGALSPYIYENESRSFGNTIDSMGCIYITGCTSSTDFPTKNPYQARLAGALDNDAFITKFSSCGSYLIYSTYLGGAVMGDIGAFDEGWDIAVDSEGYAYVTGDTTSMDFPRKDAFRTYYLGEWDGFITKLSSCGSYLVFSTYYGLGCHIAVDSARCVYKNADPYGRNAVSKLSSSGTSQIYAYYLDECATRGVAVDDEFRSYLVGFSSDPNYPLKNPYQSTIAGGSDAVVCMLSSSGSTLLYSTFFGGQGEDWGWRIALDTTGSIYITGQTSSGDYPTLNPYQSNYAGGSSWMGDAFATKFKWVCHPTPPSPTPTPIHTPSPTPVPSSSASPLPTASPSSSPSPSCTLPPASCTPTPTCGPYVPPKRSLIPSGDFNGDGMADIAIFSPQSGLWSVMGLTTIYFGSREDIPVSGDYDGDGSADVAIFRGDGGLWRVRGVTGAYFGSWGDIPIPGDYDGNGTVDFGVFREGVGLWGIRGLTRAYLGSSGDWPVPGDYGGSGTVDLGIFRPSAGLWLIKGLTRFHFGLSADWPVPGDYSGEGAWNPSIFRPCSGLWAIRGLSRCCFGICQDYPVPANFKGPAGNEIGIFRPATGLWAIRDFTRCWFGQEGDLPVSK